MALADYLDTEFAVLDKVSVPDPMGGILYEYQEGAPFLGKEVLDNTTDMRIAQQNGAKAMYTLVVDKKIVLERGQYIRRLDDGADFHITAPTRDMTTPSHAANQFSQATMERVVL